MMIMGDLGSFIANRRKAKGLRQADIVNGLASHGYQYTGNVVTHWESGKSTPPIHDPNFVRALAEILGASEIDILVAAGFDFDSDKPEWLMQFLKKASPEQLRTARRLLEALVAEQEQQTH